MANVSKLRTFLQFTAGGRNPGRSAPVESGRPQQPVALSDRDAVGVNGASVNDIQNLIDYTPPPEQGPPAWAADAARWNAALRTLGVEHVNGDEAIYEAAAFQYHALGGQLMTAEDMGEEIEESDNPEEPFVPTEFAREEQPSTLLTEGLVGDEDDLEVDDGLDGEIAAAESGVDDDDAGDDEDYDDGDPLPGEAAELESTPDDMDDDPSDLE